jgi:hypothetical protein
MNNNREAWMYWCASAFLAGIGAANDDWVLYFLAVLNALVSLGLWKLDALIEQEKKDAPKDSAG